MSESQDITGALVTLATAGALVLPREATVRKASIGKVWSGKKENGELWVLEKKGFDVYVTNC